MGDPKSISVLGAGIVTPVAVGGGRDVLAAAEKDEWTPREPYGAVPESAVETLPQLSKEMKRDRSAWVTGVALHHACQDAGVVLKDFSPDRIALVLGTAFAGQLGMMDFAAEVREQSARFVSPIHFPQTVGNYVAGVLSRSFTIQGPNLTLASGASSGLGAVVKACALLNDGAADLAIAGGFEILSPDLVRGMNDAPSDSGEPTTWSEGACLYVLCRSEDAVGRVPLGVITAWSSSWNATDVDEHSAAHLVGHSLAAESAARLAAAIHSAGAPGVRIVSHHAASVSVTVPG